MKSSAAATISLANPTTLKITPGVGRSLYQIQRALSRNRVNVSISPLRAEAYVSLSCLDSVCAALGSLGYVVEQNASLERARSQDAFAEAVRAKGIVANLSDDGNDGASLLWDLPEAKVLDPHQRQAVLAATHVDVRCLCLFDEQGLGKTVSALFAFHRLRRAQIVSKLLVLCPKNMVLEWERDVKRFFGELYRIVPIIGNQKQKRELLKKRSDIYVTNFETPVQLLFALKQLLEAERGRVLLVVDESFYVKNTRALRTRAVRELRRSVSRCLVLCGTPAPNRPHDLVEQFNIADNGVAFRDVLLPEDRAAAVPVVREVIESRGVYLRRLKQQALPDLLPKSFQEVVVPLQPEQYKLYDESLNELLHELEHCDDRTFGQRKGSFIAKRMRLLQICSNPKKVAPGYIEVPAKLLALDSILEELVGRRKEKVIVWSFFTASLEAIVDRYRHYNPVRVDGQVPDVKTRRDAVARFQEDQSTMLFVANPAAAGAGVTLHRARYAVYESMSNQGAHYLQSLDRIHRRGQLREVEYIILLCDQTIEQSEYSHLVAKELIAQSLLGDPKSRRVTRTQMLSEAQNAAKILHGN
jgi:SNF2 family DNA or RNA helicase